MSNLSLTIGPYEILEPLGKGGMGVVYRARHPDAGRVVALKTVRVPHAGMLGGIRREIHALGRLQHPGIVSFLDEGVEDGTPWYAMELLEGVSLRQVIQYRRWPEGGALDPETPMMTSYWSTALSQEPTAAMELQPPFPARAEVRPGRSRGLLAVLPQILTFARRLCAPLAYMHGEGLVHRDLKPDNIVLRPDGTPVLVDFGLMSQFGGETSRAVFELGGSAAGTWAYMPPEQARGEVVDARADLYALGCILYELVSGAPPFGFGDARQLRRAHAEGEPDPLTGIPDELARLIERLLAKAPSDRLGHADDVAAMLAALGAENGMGGPRPRPHLYRPLLVGRSEVMQELSALLERAKAGHGGLVLLGGESGVGKTHLAMELGKLARRSGMDVLVGDCDRGAPLQPFAKPLQSVGDRCREKGSRLSERLFGPRARVLSVIEPSLRDIPGQSERAEPVELPSREARIRLFSYLAETLGEIGGEKPLLLVLDDLQWADELTTSFLEFLVEAGATAGAPLLLLGTYRSDEKTEALSRLSDAEAVADFTLGRLDERAVGRMVKEMLALEAPPPSFTRFLLRRSEGVPFFVAEYLRAAVAEGLLRRDPNGTWRVGDEGDDATERNYEALPLPTSLSDLVTRRLETLAPEAGALVDVAAVLGREMTVELLLRAGREETEDEDVLEELRARQVFDVDGERVTFSHDRIREVGYARIPPERRRRLHERAALSIEELYQDTLEAHFAELGRHWDLAGDAEKARPCYLEAARRAASAYAHGEAERLYRAYLALVEEPTLQSIEARNRLGLVLEPMGRNDEAQALYLQSVEEAVELQDPAAEADSLRWLGNVYRATGQVDESSVALERSIRLCRELGDRGREGRGLGGLAILHKQQGRVEMAQELYEQAIVIEREVGNRRGLGTTLGNLANLYSQQGRKEEATAMFEEAVAIKRSEGDRSGEAVTLSNLANLLVDQGRLEEARAFYEQSLAIHRQVGARRVEGHTLFNLGYLYMSLGRPGEALELFEQSLATARAVGDRRFEGWALGTVAELRLEQGQKDEAFQTAERALEVARAVGDQRTEGLALATLAQVHRDQGRFQEAQRLHEQALALDRQVGDRGGEGLTLANLASLQMELGRMAEAREMFAQSLAIAREVGDRRREGGRLTNLATLELITSGDAGRASTLVSQAEACLLQVGDKSELGRLRCTQGHVAVASGADPGEFIAQARELAAEVAAGADSELSGHIRKLERAWEACRAGQPLVGGFSSQDITDGQRAWLSENRPPSSST